MARVLERLHPEESCRTSGSEFQGRLDRRLAVAYMDQG